LAYLLLLLLVWENPSLLWELYLMFLSMIKYQGLLPCWSAYFKISCFECNLKRQI
jgi:hypothetical protein